MKSETTKAKNEIILYQPDNAIQLDVMIDDDTVWLTQAQMTVLFETTKQNVSLHINNIFREQELERVSVVKDFLTTANDGKNYLTQYYNLDVIISVGYRVKSKQGTKFRIWATKTLKEYLLRGYVVSQRFEQIDNTLSQHKQILMEHQKQIDFIVRTEIPPKEGIFYDGQIFDAYTFIADLVKTAKREIILIDNYLDESVLMLLSKRAAKVKATIYTKAITPAIKTDLSKHNAQYPKIFIEEKPNIHDRFILIDNDVYHIG
ncbi:MAG: virulence RhuM family protein, partial [Bacteroidales bacterium]|nr:virulence RhuM family protein [Bacteroidales bacterium]